MTKILFDFIISLVLIVLLIPLWVIILITPYVSIFKQTRVGRFGKYFTIYKIKTMKDGRVTSLGKFLRKYKIDELPQLFNILKGDMSFVGPRPDIPGYYDKLIGKDRGVLLLKPGLTSLAAIKYRNEEALLARQVNPSKFNTEIIFPDKVKMNLDYLEKRSFWYDINIIVLTIKSLFF
ncbi:sugar transferase [Dokdonia sp. MED134]|uniref:sugar transferase n=1 Tax=Dokdonia sp. MED134 TaxID=313590 RepID=UPI000068AB49|nr:sugar transferase [Dokdonia sp. MED134]EAQ40272.1 sugar transferase [Dokdonia sp. MED134]